VKFYRDGLKLLLSSASKESIAFFKMGGTVHALYPWDKLAEDAQVPDAGHGFRGVTLAHNVTLTETRFSWISTCELEAAEPAAPADGGRDAGSSESNGSARGRRC